MSHRNSISVVSREQFNKSQSQFSSNQNLNSSQGTISDSKTPQDDKSRNNSRQQVTSREPKSGQQNITSGGAFQQQNTLGIDPALYMIIQILKKNSESRTQVDTLSIIPYIREQKFFAKHQIQGKDLNDVCELLQYEFYPQHSIISTFNETNDQMYIILEGQVDARIDLRRRLISEYDVKELSTDLELTQSQVAIINQARVDYRNLEYLPTSQQVKVNTDVLVATFEQSKLLCVQSLLKDLKGYKKPYQLIATENTHLACFSKKSYERILERIYKKYVQKEINFLRYVEQFSQLSKRILTKVFNLLKLHKFKRAQVLFKEGDESQYLYIVKEGELEVKKYVYESKISNKEYDLLHNPSTTKKFNSNFAKVQGLKITNQISLFMLGVGKMVGDDEAIRGCKHLSTVICHSSEAKIFQMKKDEFLKIKLQSEEAWSIIIQSSADISKLMQQAYLEKTKNACQVTSALKENENIKSMCNSLMKEMLWAQIPQTIKLYELQKFQNQNSKTSKEFEEESIMTKLLQSQLNSSIQSHYRQQSQPPYELYSKARSKSVNSSQFINQKIIHREQISPLKNLNLQDKKTLDMKVNLNGNGKTEILSVALKRSLQSNSQEQNLSRLKNIIQDQQYQSQHNLQNELNQSQQTVQSLKTQQTIQNSSGHFDNRNYSNHPQILTLQSKSFNRSSFDPSQTYQDNGTQKQLIKAINGYDQIQSYAMKELAIPMQSQCNFSVGLRSKFTYKNQAFAISNKAQQSRLNCYSSSGTRNYTLAGQSLTRGNNKLRPKSIISGKIQSSKRAYQSFQK